MCTQLQMDLLHLKHRYLWLPGKRDVWPFSVWAQPPTAEIHTRLYSVAPSHSNIQRLVSQKMTAPHWCFIASWAVRKLGVAWVCPSWKRGNCIRFPQWGASLLLGFRLVSLGGRGHVEERDRNTSKQSDFLLSSPLSLTALCFISMSERLICEKVVVIKPQR